MNKKKWKIGTILFIVIGVISVSLSVYAHSGRTDSSGGHKDNKNKSGLGSYHYHCGGHSAHLHKNGVCPYKSKSSTSSSKTKSSSSTSSSSKTSSSKSKSSSTKTVSTKPVTIKATSIKINEEIKKIFVGESETLTATILPTNVTNKTVTWKSSNKDIATVTSKGKVTAKKVGSATITASTSNGKTDTLKINIVENEQEIEEIKNQNIVESNVVETDTIIIKNTNKLNNLDNTIGKSEDSDTAGGIITLSLLAGGYWLYRKPKKLK